MPQMTEYLHCVGCNKAASPMKEIPSWWKHVPEKAPLARGDPSLLGGADKSWQAEATSIVQSSHQILRTPVGTAVMYLDLVHNDRFCRKSQLSKEALIKERLEMMAKKNALTPLAPKPVTQVEKPVDYGDMRRKMVTAMVTEALEPVLGADIGDNPEATLATCKTRPLEAIGMLGVWYRYKHDFMGRCNYCGEVTKVTEAQMTNGGLSCLFHDHDEFPLDHVHRRAMAWGRGDTEAALAPMINPARIPYESELPHRCAFCLENYTNWVIYAFDTMYRLITVPMCRSDLERLKYQIPVSRLGEPNALAIEPIPIHILLGFYKQAFDQRQRRKVRESEKAESVKII